MHAETKILLKAMQEAGLAIVNLPIADLEVRHKSYREIVTKGDLLANDILKAQLLGAFPDDGWLSEESVDDVSRQAYKRVGIVDPIDGTKEFAAGVPEYAISVALVEAGEVILASVFNPATNELFHAIKGEGAWLNHEKIHCRKTDATGMLLLASRSEYKRGEWGSFQQQHEVKQVGSIAYKLALVAAGQADATFSLGPKNEWDIAAGVLLVLEAGGVVTDQCGQAFVFNRENVLVDGIVATSCVVNEAVFSLINVNM